MSTLLKYCMALLLFSISLFTQSLESLETAYYQSDKNRRYLESEIDSLNSILEVKADHIDQAKSAKKPESQIKRLMSEAIVISSAIETNQEKIKNLTEKLSQLEQYLIKIYSQKIDSLKNIKYASSGEDIEWQILDYTYRKFFISPGANELTFNPQRMLAITKEVKDSALVREYLTEAINEVDSQVVIIKSLHEEIKAVYKLQEQAGTFFDDVEMDQDFRSYSIETSNSKLTLESDAFQNFYENFDNRQSTQNSLLYRQLLNIIQNPSEVYPIDSEINHMTLDEYKKMLEDLLIYLNSYCNVLKDSIKQVQ
jgi:NTP pyrophosphatase (non-canonical NTP hydrolase)